MPSRIPSRPPAPAPRRRLRLGGAALLLAAGTLHAQAEGHQHEAPAPRRGTPQLGEVHFPTSAPPAAQARFLEGVKYLHSFEYAAAARAFQAAQRLAPRFALAYWGEAMTHHHPVWDQQDTAAARAVLRRLGATPEARAAAAPTVRERAWLATAEVLYFGEGSKPTRDTLWLRAMERLSAAHPGDDEARAFTALAWLGLNQGVRRIPDYMRAGAIALDVFQRRPRHPGAAHYVIHAFDDPAHAVLALPAARAYSRIAPSAGHAQHMTTHIFLALGMWEENNRQNRLALAASGGASAHYTEWLAYGLAQQGRYREALALADSARAHGLGEPMASALGALIQGHVAIARGAAEEAVAEPGDLARARPLPRAARLFTRGFLAAQAGDTVQADRSLAELQALREAAVRVGALEGAQLGLFGALLQVARDARGTPAQRTAATRRAREAAALEDSLPVEFGPPATLKPAHELLGEVLLAQGEVHAAQRAFQRALAGAPGRARALAGLVRAATAAGDRPVAEQALAQLAAQWASADDGGAALRALRLERTARVP